MGEKYSRNRAATALILLTESAFADTLLSTSGPYTWNDGCGGTMTMTVKVYKDVTGLTGLYKWDYEIHNDSIASQFGDDAVNGSFLPTSPI